MRARRFHAFVVVAAALIVPLSLGGCPSKKPKTPACASNADCKDGLACINKVCATPEAKPECTKDEDCADGKVCQANKCRACANDGECGPGGRCNSGACTRAKACKSDDDCEEDEDCINGRCIPGMTAGPVDTTCQLATVYFDFDAAAIAASERDRLDANGACLNKEAAKSVYVVGHTDASGTDEYNIALSERRARSVADYLARLGVDPARLQVVPKGETSPSGQGDDKDRRVEFQWR